MKVTKPFEISKILVFQAYKEVKVKKGGAGVDQESIEGFERGLKKQPV